MASSNTSSWKCESMSRWRQPRRHSANLRGNEGPCVSGSVFGASTHPALPQTLHTLCFAVASRLFQGPHEYNSALGARCVLGAEYEGPCAVCVGRRV
eukprot:109353-Chlamydomonas_euryale.AAC.2